MADSPGINPALKTVDEIINFGLYNIALRAAKDALIADFPILAAPVISIIFSQIMSLIANKIYTELTNVAAFTVITIQTDHEKATYSAAEGALRAAMLKGDPNVIKNAESDFNKALASLVRSDGSSAT